MWGPTAQWCQQFDHFILILPQDACLLGAPLSNGRALDQALEARCNTLRSAVSRLKILPSHDALVVLRSSFNAPRLMHTLICAPCYRHPALQNFDDLLRDGVSSITNSSLMDTQWIQASLPIRSGGLGNRRGTSLALSAFLSVQCPHSSDWQHALPISLCDLRLDNEAVRGAVGLRLGLELCQPLSCPCGAMVDAKGLHGLSCKMSADRSLRHFQINDVIFRALKQGWHTFRKGT